TAAGSPETAVRGSCSNSSQRSKLGWGGWNVQDDRRAVRRSAAGTINAHLNETLFVSTSIFPRSRDSGARIYNSFPDHPSGCAFPLGKVVLHRIVKLREHTGARAETGYTVLYEKDA